MAMPGATATTSAELSFWLSLNRGWVKTQMSHSPDEVNEGAGQKVTCINLKLIFQCKIMP